MLVIPPMFGLRIVLPLAVLAVLQNPALAQPKLTLESISEDRRLQLFEQIDRAAVFEQAARACRMRTNAEARARAAVQDCVAPETLGRVAARFQRQIKQQKPIPAPAQFCANPEAQRLLQKYAAFLDQALSEAYTLCRRCLTFGVCG